MRRTLKLFLLKPGAPLGAPPEPGPELELEARSDDGFLEAARHAVAERGQRVRSLSFTPSGLVAYVEQAS